MSILHKRLAHEDMSQPARVNEGAAHKIVNYPRVDLSNRLIRLTKDMTIDGSVLLKAIDQIEDYLESVSQNVSQTQNRKFI